MVGNSPAGRRIYKAGVAFQRAHPEEQELPPPKYTPVPKNLAPVEKEPQRWWEPPEGLNCREIISWVEQKYALPTGSLLSRSSRYLAKRQEAIYWCVQRTKLSFAAIGSIFGRNHRTIGASAGAFAIKQGLPPPRGKIWASALELVSQFRRYVDSMDDSWQSLDSAPLGVEVLLWVPGSGERGKGRIWMGLVLSIGKKRISSIPGLYGFNATLWHRLPEEPKTG